MAKSKRAQPSSIPPDSEADALYDRQEEASSSSSDEELDPATKNVPLGHLLSQQQDGLTDSQQRNRVHSKVLGVRRKKPGAISKRENKNRPVEMSSRRPVSRLRQVVEAPSRKSNDPRFDQTAKKVKDEVAKKRYAFLVEESLPQERQDTVKLLKRAKSAARRKELQGSLTRIQQQIRSAKEEMRLQEAEKDSKAKERAAVKDGKKPFFLKRSEKRRQELVERFKDLKATGRLEKVMAKKRKKNAAKDHRYLPSAPRS